MSKRLSDEEKQARKLDRAMKKAAKDFELSGTTIISFGFKKKKYGAMVVEVVNDMDATLAVMDVLMAKGFLTNTTVFEQSTLESSVLKGLIKQAEER